MKTHTYRDCALTIERYTVQEQKLEACLHVYIYHALGYPSFWSQVHLQLEPYPLIEVIPAVPKQILVCCPATTNNEYPEHALMLNTEDVGHETHLTLPLILPSVMTRPIIMSPCKMAKRHSDGCLVHVASLSAQCLKRLNMYKMMCASFGVVVPCC